MSGEWEARTNRPVEPELIGVDRLPIIRIGENDLELTDEQREHRAAAVAAAAELAKALGAELVHVSVSGNANPGHEPREDLEAERITVTVWSARKG